MGRKDRRCVWKSRGKIQTAGENRLAGSSRLPTAIASLALEALFKAILGPLSALLLKTRLFYASSAAVDRSRCLWATSRLPASNGRRPRSLRRGVAVGSEVVGVDRNRQPRQNRELDPQQP